MLKKLQHKDLDSNFHIKKELRDLHLESARNEQYKLPYFSIFKLKNLEKLWIKMNKKNSPRLSRVC